MCKVVVAKIWSRNLERRNMHRFFSPRLRLWMVYGSMFISHKWLQIQIMTGRPQAPGAPLGASGGIFPIITLYVVHTKIFVWPSQMFSLFSSIFQHHEKVVEKNNDQRNHFFKTFDSMSWVVTLGQKEGGIYLSPWNHHRWLSQQRTNKAEYVFSFWWMNQELKTDFECLSQSDIGPLQIFYL